MYGMDSLVEQTVTSVSGSSFVYNIDQNVVEHRFLRTARALEENENAHYSKDDNTRDSKDENAWLGRYTSVKLEAVPYGLMF